MAIFSDEIIKADASRVAGEVRSTGTMKTERFHVTLAWRRSMLTKRMRPEH